MMLSDKALRAKSLIQLLSYGLFIGAILLLPLFMDIFWLNRMALYLVYGLLGLAISMTWGYGGILNLGQATFFGLGAYMLAASLTLAHPSASPVPEFMLLNKEPGAPDALCCVTPGSFLWMPFANKWFGIAMGVVAPVLLALGVGYAMFARRTSGVYVAIITLAMTMIVQLLIINTQPLTNGFNGLARLETLSIGGLLFDPYSSVTYYLVAAVLCVVLVGGKLLLASRAGLILRAIQADENRARFFGYDVARYKMFIFSVSAAIAGVAGMLFVVVSEFASPALMAIPFSISMVIWAAVGGRGSLLGGCIGAILVNLIGAEASESQMFQPVWPILLGSLFIGVVLFMPRGLAGYGEDLVNWVVSRLWPAQSGTASPAMPAPPTTQVAVSSLSRENA